MTFWGTLFGNKALSKYVFSFDLLLSYVRCNTHNLKKKKINISKTICDILHIFCLVFSVQSRNATIQYNKKQTLIYHNIFKHSVYPKIFQADSTQLATKFLRQQFLSYRRTELLWTTLYNQVVDTSYIAKINFEMIANCRVTY